MNKMYVQQMYRQPNIYFLERKQGCKWTFFRGKLPEIDAILSQMETKTGPEVQYFCWVLLSSPGVNNSLSTIFLGHPVSLHTVQCTVHCALCNAQLVKGVNRVLKGAKSGQKLARVAHSIKPTKE